MEGESRSTAPGVVHKYVRNSVLYHFGAESLKEKLIPLLEETINKALSAWTTQASVEVKQAVSAVSFKQLNNISD